MHPILFEFGGFPVYTYGVLLAAAYLLGLQFALIRARRAASTASGSWTSASGSSSARSSARSCCS